MILTRKSHNCAGTAFVQGDSAGGSKLTEQTLILVNMQNLKLLAVLILEIRRQKNFLSRRERVITIRYLLPGIEQN